MARARKKVSKRAVAAGIAVATLASGIIAYKALIHQTAYTVTRVIDGDTFETQEKQRVRINGIQAPETGLCGSAEATKILERHVLNKKVFMKIIYLDAFRRDIADVYLPDGRSLAYVLAEEGSVYVLQKSASDSKLLAIGNDARTNNRGIFGEPCTQTENVQKSSCVIKGNYPRSNSKGSYHLPGCKSYKTAMVQLYLGDQWFCTEKEAQKAGFTKAETCP